MPRTCTLCRERGVRCDGVQPICGQCMNFGAVTGCDYSSRAAGSSSKGANLLQKGAACLSCRKKKKKCDAKRPSCSTCKASNKEAQCLYEDDAQRTLIQSLVQRTRQLEERLASAEWSPRNSPPLQWSRTPTPDVVLPAVQFLNTLPTDQPGNIPVWEPPAPNTRWSPSFQPAPARTTWEQFHYFRSLFLSFSPSVGLKFGPAAIDALIKGDFYSPHIHPSLVHAAQLGGCLFSQRLNGTPSLPDVEAFELEATLSLLTDDTPPLIALQVHNIVAVCYVIRKNIAEGLEHVRLASEVVQRRRLRFVPPSAHIWDPLQELEPEAEELVCAMSHLLYMNTNLHMAMGVPSELDAEYEQEFQSVPMMHPALSRTHLSILRVRGALLLQRTRQLSAHLHALPVDPWHPRPHTQEESPWLAEYWSLLEEAELTLANVNPTLLKASLQPDQRSPAHALKVCLIVTLTASALLHHIAPMEHAESRQHCLDAVLKLVGIGKTFSHFEMLDPILGVCWLTAANVAFEESMQQMDELSAANWATARSVLVACVPMLADSLPYLAMPLNQILERAASFGFGPH